MLVFTFMAPFSFLVGTDDHAARLHLRLGLQPCTVSTGVPALIFELIFIAVLLSPPHLCSRCSSLCAAPDAAFEVLSAGMG
jgi:hypothetical protein